MIGENRTNQDRVPTLPGDFQLIATAYGSGADESVAVLLAYSHERKEYATWEHSAKNGACYSGHYFNIEVAGPKAFADACTDWIARAQPLVSQYYRWSVIETEGEERWAEIEAEAKR